MLQILAHFLAWPPITNWLIRRARRRPYSHLPSNSDPSYMERYWLFNPYPETHDDKWRFPISVRLHYIRRPDSDRHLHDHPWNARTFILRGWYREQRLLRRMMDEEVHQLSTLTAGSTAAIRFGEYHAITDMAPEGVWTLFVTGKYRGTWGFDVRGRKVPYRNYFAARASAEKCLEH